MTAPGNFEDQLLERLRGVVAENEPSDLGPPPARHRNRRLLLAGAGGVVVVAAVAVAAGSGGASKAYAVDTNPDGTVTVSIDSLRDGGGLQRSLSEAGVPAIVDYAGAAVEGECVPAVPADDDSAPAVEPSVEGAAAAPVEGEAEPGSEVAPTVEAVEPGGAKELRVVTATEPAEFTVDPAELEEGEVLTVTAATEASDKGGVAVATLPAATVELCEPEAGE